MQYKYSKTNCPLHPHLPPLLLCTVCLFVADVCMFIIVSDGVVLIDPEYLKDRKVYANILAAFCYGREDLDVLGLAFRKDLFGSTVQVNIYIYRTLK